MIGRRVYLKPDEDPIILRQSEYAEHPTAKGLWFFVPPGKNIACVYDRNVTGNSAHHTVTEHEDGTITISPSILLTDGEHRQIWHGYLERGVWRDC